MKRKNIVIFLIILFSIGIAQQKNQPKNVIIMIGDGLGFNHLLATDYFIYGKGEFQKFYSFPYKFASATYPAKVGSYPDKLKWGQGYNPVLAWESYDYLKQNFTESAASGTAIATGKKTYNNSIGLDIEQEPITNLTELAKSLGKSAGVISSVPFCHATPASFVAHSNVRSEYSKIAIEMLLNSKCDVIMGAGHPDYDDNGEFIPDKKKYEYVGDSLFWSQLKQGNLTKFRLKDTTIELKDCNFDGKPDSWTLIEKKEDFQKLMKGNTPKRLLGVPYVHTTLQQGRKGNTEDEPFLVPFNQNVPTLAEMSLAAINVLDNNKQGFFLMIEGGAIDWASHLNQTGRMIEEVNDFNKAIDTVIHWIEKNSNWDETLLIITADHETGLLWGPETNEKNTLFNPIINNGKGKVPTLKWNTKNHSNSLVPFFAKGSGAWVYDILADEYDPVRGRFIHNSEVAQGVFILWKK